jgi:predicted secreted Zn-dependent protease
LIFNSSRYIEGKQSHVFVEQLVFKPATTDKNSKPLAGTKTYQHKNQTHRKNYQPMGKSGKKTNKKLSLMQKKKFISFQRNFQKIMKPFY